jgi:VWFA-related protein
MKRALLALLFAVPLFAQRYDESITVNIVEVPVYVERFGEPVRGLTREDFELFVNGKRHPIEYFEVLDVLEKAAPQPAPAAPAATGAAPAELKRRRLMVLLFDVGASSPYALQRAREAALKQVAEGDTLAVATIGRTGVRFVVPFTTDAVALRRAIGTFVPSDARDPLRIATLDTERKTWRGAEAGAGEFADVWGTETRGGFSTSVAVMNSQESYDTAMAWETSDRQMRDRRFADDLAGLADRLAPLQGVKHVVLLSERRNLDVDRPDPMRRVPSLSDPFTAAKQVHEHYRAAGVILDAVDIRAPYAPGAQAGRWSAASRGSLDNLSSPLLHTLADDTGGAVATSLAQLQKRNGIAYVIGFRTTGKQKAANAIDVRVKGQRSFTEVRARKAYATGAGKGVEDGLLLADTILNDIPQRGVTLDLQWKGATLEARIPGAELLAQASGAPLLLDYYFYVFDERGHAAAWNRIRVAVDLEKARPFLSTSPYTFRQQFQLQPGRYAAKVLVRMAGTEKTGFARSDFDIP